MSKIERHPDEEDKFHAEILYVLFGHRVTLAELPRKIFDQNGRQTTHRH